MAGRETFATPPIQVKTSREQALNLTAGSAPEVLRVRCRYEGTRLWSSFLLVPDEDQTLDFLEVYAADAASSYLARKA